MASQTATGSGSTNNNTGRVLGGNPSGTTFTDLTLATNATDARNTGAPVANSTDTQASISGRAFAKTRAGQYIINGFSTKIAGVADTALSSPGSTAVNPKFSKLETVKTGFLKTLSWTSVSVDLPVYTKTQSPKTVSMGTDNSATTTKRITFQNGSNVPVTTTTSY
jgi:hypothetical protein